MYQDLTKKHATIRIGGIAYGFLFAMLFLFLFFALFGEAEAVFCSGDNEASCNACSNEGLCWYYSPFCYWSPLSQDCHWQNVCYLGHNYLQYCSNQLDCELNEGTWYNETCWWGDPYLTSFVIDFENYATGSIWGQDNWTYDGLSGSYAIIQTDDVAFGEKALKIYNGSFGVAHAKRIYGETLKGLDIMTFYNKTLLGENDTGAIFVNGVKIVNGWVGYVQILALKIQNGNLYYYDSDISDYVWIGLYEDNTFWWHTIKIEIYPDIDKIEITLDDTYSTVKIDAYEHNEFDYFYSTEFSAGGTTGAFHFIDNISFGSITCKIQNCSACLNEISCKSAGCWWNWANSTCFSTVGACGYGENVQFCTNKIDCEYYGGFWSGNYCFWGEAPPTIPAIPDFNTVPISTLAGFLSPLIESVGGFLTAFENIFDIAKATEKGALFGSAIPNAIAYSSLISNFFGGLPIGEGLLFFVIAIIVVSIFRLVIKLIHIIKP